MNSQFKNSNLGFYLYAMIIIIIAAASIFVFWYMVKGYKLGTYPENTILGSVYLGGITEEDVEPKLINRIERWLNDETIVFEVTYQGYSYEFDRELFYFDIETSIFYLDSGVTNELVVRYQGTDRHDIINDIEGSQFLLHSGAVFDMERLINDILNDAGYMKSFSSKKLEDYIINETEAYGPINSVTITIPEGMLVDDMISGINSQFDDSKIIIGSKELFDVVDTFSSSLSDSEMTVLSTGMLALILETNFAINEVHYVPIIDYINYNINTFPNFGHNADIAQNLGDSFSFYNPNVTEYYFTLVKDDDTTATLTLVGLKFVDNIVVTIDKKPIEYITQTTDKWNIIQFGYKGAIVEVTRTITNIYGVVIYEKVIVFEFYPPIKEIILEP